MLTQVHPKLPMRDQAITHAFYTKVLKFRTWGGQDYDGYLMLERDGIQLHFFLYVDLNVGTNDGQIYIRTDNIQALYEEAKQDLWPIHPNGELSLKPWGVEEFSILDPDNNLITFGQTHK